MNSMKNVRRSVCTHEAGLCLAFCLFFGLVSQQGSCLLLIYVDNANAGYMY